MKEFTKKITYNWKSDRELSPVVEVILDQVAMEQIPLLMNQNRTEGKLSTEINGVPFNGSWYFQVVETK